MDFKKFEKLNNSKILSDNSPLIKKKDTFFEMNRESALNKKPNDKKKLTTSLIHQQNAPKILNMVHLSLLRLSQTSKKPLRQKINPLTEEIEGFRLRIRLNTMKVRWRKVINYNI